MKGVNQVGYKINKHNEAERVSFRHTEVNHNRTPSQCAEDASEALISKTTTSYEDKYPNTLVSHFEDGVNIVRHTGGNSTVKNTECQ